MVAEENTKFEEEFEEFEEIEKSTATKIGEFIGRHILGFAFLGGAIVGSGYTKMKMNRQFKAKTKTWENMLSATTGTKVTLF